MNLKIFIEFENPNYESNGMRNFGVEQIANQLVLEFSKNNGISDISNEELWLDAGIFFKCSFGENSFLIFIAKYEINEPWQLTIELEKYPSFFSKIFGKYIYYTDDLKKFTVYTFKTLLKCLNPSNINVCISSNVEKVVKDPSKLDWS